MVEALEEDVKLILGLVVVNVCGAGLPKYIQPLLAEPKFQLYDNVPGELYTFVTTKFLVTLVPQAIEDEFGLKENVGVGGVSTIVIFLITTVLKPPFGAGIAETSSDG